MREFFHSEFESARCVAIPDRLTGAARQRFVAAVRSAVRTQSELAAECASILRPIGEPVESDTAIRVEHEPVAPMNVAALLERGRRPELGTLGMVTTALLAALGIAGRRRIPHGGLQPAALLLDARGGLKVSDFGIVPVFQAACGDESREQLRCLPGNCAAGGRYSEWRLCEQSLTGIAGTLAAFSAPEILSGEGRPGPLSDLYSAGILLYALACGEHPLASRFENPALRFHPTLDPLDLAEARPDWSEPLRRGRNGVALSTDRPILDWAACVGALLTADPSERSRKTRDCAAIEAASPAALAVGVGRAPAGGPTLRFQLPDGAIETRDFPVADSELIVGRGSEATMRIPGDAWLSRTHVRFWARDGEPHVEDLASRHGTHLNGRRLSGAARLNPGDSVRAGTTVVTFQCDFGV